MKTLFENWQKYIDNPAEDQERNPKVVCNCACTDCIFNRNKRCVAESIDLQFAQKEDGSTICECITYEINERKREVEESAFSGNGPISEPIDEQ